MNESQDLRVLAERGELILRLKGGEIAARLAPPPALPLMAANGHPPEGLVWGERFFFLSAEGQYVEGLLYPLLAPARSASDAPEGARRFSLTAEGEYVEAPAEGETPRGGATGAPRPSGVPAPRPGTRMLDLPPAPGDPARLAAQSTEKQNTKEHSDEPEEPRHPGR